MSIHPLQDDQTGHSGQLDDHARQMVGRGGLEPPTSRLSGVRSNHLSYRPIFIEPVDGSLTFLKRYEDGLAAYVRLVTRASC